MTRLLHWNDNDPRPLVTTGESRMADCPCGVRVLHHEAVPTTGERDVVLLPEPHDCPECGLSCRLGQWDLVDYEPPLPDNVVVLCPR